MINLMLMLMLTLIMLMLVLTLKGDVEDHALVDVGADEVDVDNFDVDMW